MRGAAAIALVAALALTGCGRLAPREAGTPEPTASTSPSAVAEPGPSLDEIGAQLDVAGTALDESAGDLADGDEAAGGE